MTIRIVLADDHPLIRAGLAAMIGLEPDLELAGEASNGQEAVELWRTLRPDVLVIDLSMPVMNGVEAIRAIMREDSARIHSPAEGELSSPIPPRILVLTVYEGDEDIHQALEAGAMGYLFKDTAGSRVVEAIRSASQGQRVIPKEVAARLQEGSPRVELTARELEVLMMVAAGFRNRQIAAAIGRTEETVKVHVRSLLGKLGAVDRTQAGAIALERGIIHPGSRLPSGDQTR